MSLGPSVRRDQNLGSAFETSPTQNQIAFRLLSKSDSSSPDHRPIGGYCPNLQIWIACVAEGTHFYSLAGLAPRCDHAALHPAALVMPGQKREARLRARCPGHPRLSSAREAKAWMARDSPATTLRRLG